MTWPLPPLSSSAPDWRSYSMRSYWSDTKTFPSCSTGGLHSARSTRLTSWLITKKLQHQKLNNENAHDPTHPTNHCFIFIPFGIDYIRLSTHLSINVTGYMFTMYVFLCCKPVNPMVDEDKGHLHDYTNLIELRAFCSIPHQGNDDGWSIQLKCHQVIFWAQVGNITTFNPSFMQQPTEKPLKTK